MIFIFNKSINLQKEIKTSENKTVAFLTGQISIGYGTINSSAQIIDKDYIANNPELFKNEYNAFLNEM